MYSVMDSHARRMVGAISPGDIDAVCLRIVELWRDGYDRRRELVASVPEIADALPGRGCAVVLQILRAMQRDGQVIMTVCGAVPVPAEVHP